METRLLQYYERELRYLRELGAEFANRFPKVAARLGLSELECADPHVERLLEGFAFMAARVHLKLDAEFPRFTQQLMELVYPHYLAPTPSMTVVQFAPNPREGSLSSGFAVPRGSVLRARSGLRDAVSCEYRTAHPVELWPIEIERVEYTSVLRDLADVRVPSVEPFKAILKIRLRTTAGIPFDRLGLKTLPLFLRGADELSARLYEQLRTSARSLIMRWGPNPSEHVELSSVPNAVRPLGFSDEHALLPQGPRSFSGYRLLQEYFAFPSRFDFVELVGLERGVARCREQRMDLMLPLTRFDPTLEGAIDLARVLLFATPAINLFPKTCDRVQLNERAHEVHVVPDRTRPLDFEVHTITGVSGYARGAQAVREFAPLYAVNGRRDSRERQDSSAHYTLERRARLASEQQRRYGARTPYTGSEVFLTLVDRDQGSHGGDLHQLGVTALCTNRDLPLLLAIGQNPDGNDFSLQSGAPVEAVRCVAGPSAPRAAPIDGDVAWRLVSHLSQNYLSLSEQGGGAEALREMLDLYAQLGDPLLRRQVEGVTGVRSQPVIRPLPADGPFAAAPRCFARGTEVTLACEEQAFSGHGVFTLASVLSAFFAKHAAINSFTETVLTTRERGEVFRWPTTAGLRHTV